MESLSGRVKSCRLTEAESPSRRVKVSLSLTPSSAISTGQSQGSPKAFVSRNRSYHGDSLQADLLNRRCRSVKANRLAVHRPVSNAHSNPLDFPDEFKSSAEANWRPQSAESLRRSLAKQLEPVDRQRNFSIDHRGNIVNEGTSVRPRSRTGSWNVAKAAEFARQGRLDSDDTLTPTPSPTTLLPPTGATPVEETPSYTVVLVGVAGVGKTTLVNQLVASEMTNSLTSSTDTDPDSCQISERVVVNVEGRECELNFLKVNYPPRDSNWRSVSTDMYVVVFSVESRSSLRSASDVLYSLGQSEKSKRKPTILIANKIDLVRPRVIQTDEGSAVAKSYGFNFMETSAMIGHNIDALLMLLVAKLRNRPDPTLLESPGGFKRDRRSFVNRLLRRRNSRSCDNLYTTDD